jgi:hypothetical protein
LQKEGKITEMCLEMCLESNVLGIMAESVPSEKRKKKRRRVTQHREERTSEGDTSYMNHMQSTTRTSPETERFNHQIPATESNSECKKNKSH